MLGDKNADGLLLHLSTKAKEKWIQLLVMPLAGVALLPLINYKGIRDATLEGILMIIGSFICGILAYVLFSLDIFTQILLDQHQIKVIRLFRTTLLIQISGIEELRSFPDGGAHPPPYLVFGMKNTQRKLNIAHRFSRQQLLELFENLDNLGVTIYRHDLE